MFLYDTDSLVTFLKCSRENRFTSASALNLKKIYVPTVLGIYIWNALQTYAYLVSDMRFRTIS